MKGTKAIVLKPSISIIMVMSHQLKKEIADSILYLTQDVFFAVLDYCSLNSNRGVHSGGDDRRRWRQRLCKNHNKPFIS